MVKRKPKKTIYLVDYDLPKKDARRRKFYRKLRTLDVEKSTNSVIKTTNKKTAKKIHRKASSIGKSNKYKIKQKK